MQKIFVSTLMIFLVSCTGAYSEEIRKPAVAGAFYPADKQELRRAIDLFLDKVEKLDTGERILAVITPHAGYVYSGHVAAHAYKQLEGHKINTAVIICNSHTAYFAGIAVDESDAWQTPLGMVRVDKDLAEKIVNADDIFQYNSAVHKKDHTIEVQIPFLQTVLKGDFRIVPILFGNTPDDSYRKLAMALAGNLGENDIVIISTDLSHYPRYEDANRIDKKTLELIKEADVSELDAHIRGIKSEEVQGEETLSCGVDGVKTAMELSNILGSSRIEILKYANSGDVEIGDKSRVVGYGTLAVYLPESLGNKEAVIMEEEYLNKQEKQKLMEIAWASIKEAVTGKGQAQIPVSESRLKEKAGAFVTIKKHGQLRGCIGYILPVKPLHETVKDVAKSAAISDFRFSPVSKDELKDLELEISVLTPLKKIDDVEDITVGKHGLYMKRGFNSGILLPQVATEYGWDRDTFLEHTCLKAGLPKDAWKDPSTEVYTYSAEVFSEGELK